MFDTIMRAFRRLWSRGEPVTAMTRRPFVCSPASFLAQLSASRPSLLAIDVIEPSTGLTQWRFSFTVEGTPEGEPRDRFLVYTLPFVPERFRLLVAEAMWTDPQKGDPGPPILRHGEIKDPEKILTKQAAH